MNGRFLIDTNIVIALFAGETTVQERLAEDMEVDEGRSSEVEITIR